MKKQLLKKSVMGLFVKLIDEICQVYGSALQMLIISVNKSIFSLICNVIFFSCYFRKQISIYYTAEFTSLVANENIFTSRKKYKSKTWIEAADGSISGATIG